MSTSPAECSYCNMEHGEKPCPELECKNCHGEPENDLPCNSCGKTRAKSWLMQVRVGEAWKDVKSTHMKEPYRYATEKIAVRMLEICYPDQCVEQRLDGFHPPYTDGKLVRVVPSDLPPNQEWP